MTDTHPIDWRFYFRPGRWLSIRTGPALPAAARAALETLAPDASGFEPSSAWPPSGADRDEVLVVLTAADAAALGSDAFARLRDHACVVVLHPPIGAGSGRGRREQRQRARPALTVRRIGLPGRRAAYYPAGSPGPRGLIWETVARPVSFRGRAARLGAASSEFSPIMMSRGETIEIHCPRERLLPVASELAILSSGLTESNPAILILAGTSADPGTLIKVPRSTERRLGPPPEVRKLARLGRLLPGAYPRSIPVPEGVEWPGTAQTFLQGQVLSSHSASERPEIVYRMASWLFDLHRASARAVKREELRPPDCSRFLQSQAAAATRNQLVPAERSGEVRRLFDILARTPLELVMCHRDAGAWNIVALRGHPFLVDWDSATWGLPGEDLLYLLLYLIYQETGAVEPGDRVEAFRARFVEPSGRPVWLREALLRLSRHLRVEGACLQALIAAVLLRHANDQHAIAHFAPGKEALAEPFSALLAAVLDAGPDPWSAAGLRGVQTSGRTVS